MDKCPCSSTKSYTECCGPVIDGSKPPATAEILMRARYTAYATGDIKFIKDTTHPKVVSDFDEASAKSWSKSSTWHGLNIISTEKGDIDDTEGVVEFVASYTQNGKEERHHERATFKKEADKWFFEDGEIIAPKPYIRETPKVGRNDPCPCNSGKKYKKCCGKS